MLQIRVSPEEKARLEEIAGEKGISVSDLVRDGALKRRIPAVRGRRAEPVVVGPAESHRHSAEDLARAAELEDSDSFLAGGVSPSGSAASASRSGACAEPGAVASPVPVFRCPVGNCLPEGGAFECRSPAVRCPVHARKVVAA